MIKAQQYATMVQTALNTYASGFTFKIYPNEGEYKKAVRTSQRTLATPIVYGVLNFMPTSTIPLTNLGIFNVQATLDILAPLTIGENANVDTTGHIDTIFNAIHSFFAAKTGSTGTLTDGTGASAVSYKYIWSINTPQTGQEVTGTFGRAVPIGLVLNWYLIKGGVLFDDITISVDGTQALCTDYAFEKTVNPQTDNIDNNAYLKSYAQSQSLSMSLILPFTDNAVCTSLYSEIFNGTLAKVYSVVVTKGTTSYTQSMIAGNIKLSSQVGLNGVIQATFMLSR